MLEPDWNEVARKAALRAAAPQLYAAVDAFVQRWNSGEPTDTEYVASLMLSAHSEVRGEA